MVELGIRWFVSADLKLAKGCFEGLESFTSAWTSQSSSQASGTLGFLLMVVVTLFYVCLFGMLQTSLAVEGVGS